MLYHAQGVITTSQGQNNIDLLIDGEDEQTIRDTLSKHSVAVFSLAPFPSSPTTFGPVFFHFQDGNNLFTIYTKYEKAREAYTYFRNLGFNITYINNNIHPLSDENVTRVMQKLQAEFTSQKNKEANPDKNYFKQITDIVVKKTGDDLNNMRKQATSAIEYADGVLTRLSGSASSVLIKIKNYQDELKKAKLGTNVSKIRDTLGELYTIMEDAELKYLESQKDVEINITEGSIVTYLDIVSEWEKFQKARKIHKAHATKSTSDTYYTFFGSAGLYQKLLGKDFENKFKDIVVIIDGLYNLLVIFVVMSIIWLVLFQLVNKVSNSSSFFNSAFIKLGLMGICAAILMKVKRPKISNLIIVGPACVALYFILYYIIKINFGL